MLHKGLGRSHLAAFTQKNRRTCVAFVHSPGYQPTVCIESPARAQISADGVALVDVQQSTGFKDSRFLTFAPIAAQGREDQTRMIENATPGA